MPSPFLPSVEEQLTAARDATDSGFAFVHIDTCLGSFLSDHHNRDGELLIGVPVDGNTYLGAVFNDVLMELREIAPDDGDRAGFNYRKALAAIEAERDAHQDLSFLFDSSLDILDDDEFNDGEYVQAWFLITWDESYRFDYDRLSGSGILVRESDGLTSLRYTGEDAERLSKATRSELVAEAEENEFS